VREYAPFVAAPSLLHRPAIELAGLVRGGEVSAPELVEAALRAIDARADLGAFTFLDPEGALAAAAAIAPGDPRPFAGVPTAIKDNRAVAGWPLTFGAALFGDFVTPGDAHLVRRLRAAGFVLVGKTTLPEYGISPTTESTRFGPTRNPWDPARTPGGSSGGAAAAVAGGLLPVAHGNDGGGSIRIPAACCGLVGLKPQRHRVSLGPAVGDSFLVVDGMLTRTVGDTAALLDVLAGPEVGDPSWAPPPPEPFAAAAARPPGRLRIGATTVAPLPGVEPHAEAERTWREGCELLAALGHEVEEIEPPWTRPGLLDLFAASFGPAVAEGIAAAAHLAGREPGPADMEPLSWMLWERARGLTAPAFLALEGELKRAARRMLVALEPYDAVLTPALAERPVAIGALTGAGPDPAETFRRSGRFTPYTAVANCTGQPAISLPLGHGADGLPTAVQLLGRPAQEGALLALAAQVQDARPWADRLAPGP
jgi:amidase